MPYNLKTLIEYFLNLKLSRLEIFKAQDLSRLGIFRAQELSRFQYFLNQIFKTIKEYFWALNLTSLESYMVLKTIYSG